MPEKRAQQFFLLEDATIDINSRIQSEIEEEKHDH